MNDEEIEIAARAMQNSKAWVAVFGPGTARTLATEALDAIRKHKELKRFQAAQDRTNAFVLD